MVLTNIRYSKLEISLLCHRCVKFDRRKSCAGDKRLVALATENQKKKENFELHFIAVYPSSQMIFF